ncbi:ABC-type nitrate/sulfonate/bicarbonate transport system, substrate-binding protein [Halobacillus alkaliphilus]|uniref:ABC-type nitrate/sulfonate/bicarbonate transport system, substrate-binding protein n=1 Tax=Halobacillus alkaliphilus TaxID=396056 RepID=A0A1I2QAK5_9BACI|nr:ABC transporter substrate-binding protein [Halobacillus alkaliphilus]SFG24950.1 ABC-type nitrate/sulfonate/bicarbonate transport system, substrate-binding protein [Halobacillus alkaliphilus]
MKKLITILTVALLVTACSSNDGNSEEAAAKQEETNSVQLVLDWTPNTNHTGIYVAQAEGFFKEQGLDVEIMLPGEAGADQLVASQKADFGISAQETLTEARIQDIPVVSIGAIIQHNTSGFASPKDKNITSPADYEGKTYGGWGAPVEEAVLSSLMQKENADVSEVEIVNMGNTDFFTAVERDIDFAWIYYGWTGVEAELRGQELNMQYLTDYSEKLDYYTPVLTTSESMINENPETVQAFMAAVSKGYEYAIEKPEQAAEILIEAVPDLDPELVKASQEWLSPKYKEDADQWGVQNEQVWSNYAEWMYNHDLLEEKLNAEEAFTNEFLPE